MNVFQKMNKEFVLYGSIIIAGTIYVYKKLFGKGDDKKIYKSKKKYLRGIKKFFVQVDKEIGIRDNKAQLFNGVYGALKNFCNKMNNEKVLNDNDKNLKNRKDEIFYYILNNVSNMVIHNKK